ncbi:MAG: hypothetical protein GWP05_02970 [Anaerolineaceae bacterium]|nr:hypothetical protein [Anaerolineaceae bacterium]
MTLTEKERGALRAHWLGEPLPKELARLLAGSPRSAARRRRRQAAQDFLAQLPEEAGQRTRRLVLTYGVAAVVRLVELMQDESKETSRKAAVDLLRLHKDYLKEELAEQAARRGAADRAVVDSLTNEQVEILLGILADAGVPPPEEDTDSE